MDDFSMHKLQIKYSTECADIVTDPLYMARSRLVSRLLLHAPTYVHTRPSTVVHVTQNGYVSRLQIEHMLQSSWSLSHSIPMQYYSHFHS